MLQLFKGNNILEENVGSKQYGDLSSMPMRFSLVELCFLQGVLCHEQIVLMTVNVKSSESYGSNIFVNVCLGRCCHFLVFVVVII